MTDELLRLDALEVHFPVRGGLLWDIGVGCGSIVLPYDLRRGPCLRSR